MKAAAGHAPSVDPLDCSLSLWTGQYNNCRWCNNHIPENRQYWCSEGCYWAFEDNHDYPRARRKCRDASRGGCGCAGRTERHAKCIDCGRCEPETPIAGDGALECNHRVPRLGDNSRYSCLHHASNLEMLCHRCHLVETRRQMLELGRPEVVGGDAPPTLTKRALRKDRRIRLNKWRRNHYFRRAG